MTHVDAVQVVEELHADLIEVDALTTAAREALERVPSVSMRDREGRRAQDRLHVLVSLAARNVRELLAEVEGAALHLTEARESGGSSRRRT